MKRAHCFVIGAALAMVPAAAMADPITIVAALAPYIGGTLAAAVANAAVFIAAYGGYIYAAAQVYGAASARRKARRAAAAARAEYNAGLQDRSVSTLRADPPWQVIYGRAVVGGAIVDIFTTDNTNARREDGTTYTKADALKHMVFVVAAHECAAIHEIYVDGVALGTLDGAGNPTNADFLLSDNRTRTVAFTDSITLDETPISVLQAYATSGEGGAVTVTISGNQLLGPAGVPVACDYLVSSSAYSVRAFKNLGASTQATNAYLASIAPSRYTANHRLRGICYVVITLDLLDPRFQGGPPNITFDVGGRLVYDPRTTLTGWSENPALCIRDFITAPWGFGASAGDVDDASIIVAANACDATISLTVGATTETGQKTFTCNGAFTTESSPEVQLDDLAECMAGSVTYGAQWSVQAGVWTPPVLSLGDDDLHGQIEVVQCDTPMSELFNGIRGQFIPRNAATPTDFNPYANSSFVASDGQELWTNITLPFTNHLARARNLCRIMVERNRSGQVLRYPAKLKAWPLQVGDRVSVTSAEYGLTAKDYRVTDWQFELTGAVVLTLQEDAASIYDLADAATADPTPNTDLPNPWVVGLISGLAATSGNATLLRTADGTVVPRVKVAWTALTDSAVINGGRIEVHWRGNGQTAWSGLEVAGGETQAYIEGIAEGDKLLIRARARNVLGARGADVFTTHLVVGKSAAPTNVSGLAWAIKPGQVVITWAACADADYAATELRSGASWAAGSVVWAGSGTEYHHPRPANGTYTVWAAHLDTSGNYSAAPASISITVDDSIDPGAASASLLRLVASGLGFIFDSPLATTSSSPTLSFEAVLQNVTGTAAFTATAYDASNTSLGTITLGGSGNTRTLTAAQFVTYAGTRYVKVAATLGALTDTTTAYRGDSGSNALNLVLGNEAHTVPTASDGSAGVYTGASTAVNLYEGITDATSSWTFAISASNCTATINGGAGPVSGTGSVTVAVSAMSADAATVTITATRSGGYATQTKVFSLAKSKAGATALTYLARATPAVITRTKTGAYTPNAIVFDSLSQSGTSAPAATSTYWSFYKGTGSTSYSWDSPITGFSGQYSGQSDLAASLTASHTALKFEMYLDAGRTQLVDVVTVPIVNEGADTVTGYLTNESVTLAADNAGTITGSISTLTAGNFKVYRGATDVTASASFSYSAYSGLTPSVPAATTGAYAVSAMSADSAYIDYTATYSGVTVTKRLTLAKSKQGTQGPTGATGSTGSTGATGSAGASAVVAYMLISSGSLPSAPAVPSGAPAGGNVASYNTWYALPPSGSLAANDWLFQASGTVTSGGSYSWSSPSYLATFKVGQLSALSADIGTVTAGDITGTRIRTASSGARIAINDTGYSNKIVGFTTGGWQMFSLDASAGIVAITSDQASTTDGALRVNTSSYSGVAISATGPSGVPAISGYGASSGTGVKGESGGSGPGVRGISASGPGGQFSSLRIDQSPTTGSGTATVNTTNKPGGSTTNSWMQLNLNGTTYYIPVWQ